METIMEVIDFEFGGITYIGYVNAHTTVVGLEMSDKNANADGICLKKFACLLARELEHGDISIIQGNGIFYNCLGFEYDMYGEKMCIVGHIIKRESEEIVDTFKYWIDLSSLHFYLCSGEVMRFSVFKDMAMKRVGYLYKHSPDAKVALDWNMKTMALAYDAVIEQYGKEDDGRRFQVYRISLVGEKWLISVKHKTENIELPF